jgi:hypothetical protein
LNRPSQRAAAAAPSVNPRRITLVVLAGLRRVAFGVIGFLALTARGSAATIAVPNGSFESPSTGFVILNVDAWQKAPKPAWYQEGQGFLWTQLVGLFKNTPVTSADHIVNCHGNQAAWLFAVPEVAMFQDYDSLDWNDLEPTRAFDVRFEPGKSYTLTVAVMGGGGGMLTGATLELALYYRDAASNAVVVAATTVTNLPTIFSNNNYLLDFSVRTPPVRATDPWANQQLGIRLLSTVTTNLQGGYWDVDNVRLVSQGETSLSGVVTAGGEFQLTVRGEPGARYELLAAADAAGAPEAWTSLGVFTNASGSAVLAEPLTNGPGRFYRVRPLP